MAILLAVRRASDIILSGASQLSKRAMSATTTEFTTLKVGKIVKAEELQEAEPFRSRSR